MVMHPDAPPLKPGSNKLNEDEIVLTVSHIPDGDNKIVIELESAPHITWWKGICNNQWEILATQDDRHGPASTTVTEDNLQGATFDKAKVLGVHTKAYPFTVEGGFKKNYKYILYWANADGE